MDNELFQQAKAQYSSKDYLGALTSYTTCLEDAADDLAPGEAGQLYHQIGNCLLKLKNPSEAIQSYTQALSDESYDGAASVSYNLGMAYAALHDYDKAVNNFETAASDAKYPTPYKAYFAMGNALMKQGKSAEAGVAFREAALDDANPEPSKALLNLGICFMALDRPADAAISYESALQFQMPSDTKNKLYSNLGQAYVACGQMQKAVNAFDQALADKTYFLSDSANVDYQRAIGMVAQGTSEIPAIPSQSAGVTADVSGLDVVNDNYPSQRTGYGYGSDPYGSGGLGASDSSYDVRRQEADEHFFMASDEELERWSRGIIKDERKGKRFALKVVIVILIVIILAFIAGAYAYLQGYGFPSQETVAAELFADPDAASTKLFAGDIDQSTASSMVELVSPDDSMVIDGVERSVNESSVYVSAHTAEGGELQYKISMVRDLIGWKISNIELYFPSQE